MTVKEFLVGCVLVVGVPLAVALAFINECFDGGS
jgi:hypothetical protein